MAQLSLTEQITNIQDLMANRLGYRGVNLQQQVAKAGRDLPRALRRDAAFFVQAEAVAYHPRLNQLVDRSKANVSYGMLMKYLQGTPRRSRFKQDIMRALGSVSLAMIVVFVVVIWSMVDRGIL